MDVAILTDTRLLKPDEHNFYISQVIYEESLILSHLKEAGIAAKRIAWSDPSVDWNEVRCAVFRSTWDYFDRFQEFAKWLEDVKDKTTLINSAEILEWNLDKKYMADLEKNGINIVPSHFVEKGNHTSLDAIYDQLNCDQAVIKPTISAAGENTYKIARQQIPDFKARFTELVATRTMMVQPFQEEIMNSGEISLMVIDGKYTHAIQKKAKAGEFRVQDDHGGKVLPYFACEDEIRFAEFAVQHCGYKPLYARVDMVRDNNGEHAIMELELIEPELFLRFDTTAAKKLSQGIISILNN